MNNKDFSSILSLIEQKFGRGSSANWKNRDFEDLNFEILKETKTNISAHTLKRIFGKIKTDEYYLPQKATILALKKFVNYNHVSLSQSEDSSSNNSSEPQTLQEIQSVETGKNRHAIILVPFAVALLVVLGYFIFKTKSDTSAEKPGIIKLLSTEGRIPKSVEFEYTTPNNKDTFRISYDGLFPPINILNGVKKKATYYYQYPGYFIVRMLKKNVAVSDATPVYIQTKGWEAFGMYNQQKQLEHIYPIDVNKYTKNGIFSPDKQDIYALGMDTSRLVEVRIANYKPTGISGDNFKIETTLKNSDVWSGSTCNSVILAISGRKEAIRLYFTNPGCSYWVRFKLSEKNLSNKNDNLSDFVFNLAEWQHFRIENRDKHISIYVNDIKRYSNSYNQSIGEIMGVTIKFQGNGYLKNFLLSDLKENAIFRFPEVSSSEK